MQKGNRQALVEAAGAKLAAVRKAVEASSWALSMHGLDREKFGLVLREAVLNNPDIITGADERSLGKAIRKCCRDNIVPDGDRGVLLVMRGEVVAMPMLAGIMQMAIEDLKAELRSGVIYADDQVEIVEGDGIGIDPSITIRGGANVFLTRTADKLIGAWCRIKLPDEDTARLVLFSKDQIARARAASRAQNGPWRTWPERMAEKSCVKSAIWRLRHIARVKSDGKRILRVIEEDTASEYGTMQVSEEIAGEATIIEASAAPVEAQDVKQGAAAEAAVKEHEEKRRRRSPPPAEPPVEPPVEPPADDGGFLPPVDPSDDTGYDPKDTEL